MNNAYEKIKSILSTGVHHVEVEFDDRNKRVFTGMIDDAFTTKKYGEKIPFDKNYFNSTTVTSIHPIPLKPKPIPINSKVDIVNEDGTIKYSDVLIVGTEEEVDNFVHWPIAYQYMVEKNGEKILYTASPAQVIPHIEEEECIHRKLKKVQMNEGSPVPFLPKKNNSQNTIHSEEESILIKEQQKLPSELINELEYNSDISVDEMYYGKDYRKGKKIASIMKTLDHLAKKNNWKA